MLKLQGTHWVHDIHGHQQLLQPLVLGVVLHLATVHLLLCSAQGRDGVLACWQHLGQLLGHGLGYVR